jgi:hypothetical protein
MGVNLARYGPVARSARRWSGAALLGAALLGSFGLAWLVLGALVLAIPANLTAEERWFGGGLVLGFGVLPIPGALLILIAGLLGRRRLSRLRQLAAVVRRRGVLDKREVERELGIGATARRQLVERAMRIGVLEERRADLTASAPSTPEEGETIGGAYVVEGVLFVGRSGPVYRVRQIRTGRHYALKRLAHGDQLPVAEVERIARMALATTDLRHPNLVQVLDVDASEGGEIYLVMELLEGESAEARVGRGTLIPWREAVHHAHQVAAALVAVHATGHYHGGLSLAEVFLTPDEAAGERAVLTPLGPSLEPVADGDGQRADVRAVGELLAEMIGEQRVPPAVGQLLTAVASRGDPVGTMEELRSALGEISRAADRYNAPPER